MNMTLMSSLDHHELSLMLVTCTTIAQRHPRNKERGENTLTNNNGEN